MTNTAVLNNQTVVETEAIEVKEKMRAAEKLTAVRHFLPLASIVGLAPIITEVLFLANIGMFLIAIGTACALTICPLKLLAFPFKCIAVGFSFCRSLIPVYGVADLTAAIFGTVFGFIFGMAVIILAPAFFTIRKYFDRDTLDVE